MSIFYLVNAHQCDSDVYPVQMICYKIPPKSLNEEKIYQLITAGKNKILFNDLKYCLLSR
jgi:hypothetical protein